MKHDIDQRASEAEALFIKAYHAEEKGMLEDAAQFLLRAANLEHEGAQVNLGNCFSWGQDVPQSDLKAAYWYKRAYKNGRDTGAFNIALDKLKEGNTRAGVFWLKRAVEMNSGEAALELAKIYLSRAKGKAKAMELLQKTQTMAPSEISEQTKEDAAALLSSLVGTRW